MIQQPQQNQFINLCQDLMFKIFFSRNKKLLLSLAQTFIFLPKGKNIEKLKIKAEGEDWLKETKMALQNPALYSKFYSGKGVVLDILATLNTGESVISNCRQPLILIFGSGYFIIGPRSMVQTLSQVRGMKL